MRVGRYWDGVTNYVVEEAEEEVAERVGAFGDWLEGQELPDDLAVRVEE